MCCGLFLSSCSFVSECVESVEECVFGVVDFVGGGDFFGYGADQFFCFGLFDVGGGVPDGCFVGELDLCQCEVRPECGVEVCG